MKFSLAKHYVRVIKFLNSWIRRSCSWISKEIEIQWKKRKLK